MNPKQKKPAVLTLITLLLTLNLIIASNAVAQSTTPTTITITRNEFFSFVQTPANIKINHPAGGAVDIYDQTYFSNDNGEYPLDRQLIVRDTRNCGGFNVTLTANPFNDVTTLNNGLRVVTHSQSSLAGNEMNGVKYIDGYTGDQNIIAPLNHSSGSFAIASTFTDPPFDTVDNVLDGPVDIMQAGLTAPDGHNGEMALGLAYAFTIPKYTPPNTYFTLLTFTLTDDTTGTCP
ncbi:hypothetical protein GF340_00420 [Candidatus Peregrinibacteria bacterium]|nr:hypothetical protein [Candidatus Peregrinibacteria bacterium]